MSGIAGLSLLSTSQVSALNQLRYIAAALDQSTKRVSTAKRINSAKDDPAGLISASLLARSITSLEAAAEGLTRASSQLSTADKAAGEIVTNLQTIRTKVLEAAGGTLSSSDVAARQIDVDALIRSIDSLSRTEFNGRRLLDGSSGFRTSGVNTTAIKDVEILDKQTTSDVTFNVNVTSTATQATNSYTGGTLGSAATVTVTGPRGSAVVSLSSGTTTTAIATAFNAVTHLTGATATMIDANQVNFATSEYGTKATMSFSVSSGTFNLVSGSSTAGTNAVATINGQTVTGDGANFTVTSDQTTVRLELNPATSGAISAFVVAGEGLQFVTGESPATTARIGLPALNSASLGGVAGKLSDVLSGGSASLIGGNAESALRIVDQAIRDATTAQAAIGGFQKYTLDSASRVINATHENVSSALSAVEDADLAYESARITNLRLLQEATVQSLALSSLRNQSVLSLLKTLRA